MKHDILNDDKVQPFMLSVFFQNRLMYDYLFNTR